MRLAGKTLGLVLFAGSLIAASPATAVRAQQPVITPEAQLREIWARYVQLQERLEKSIAELAEEKAARRVDVAKLETELESLKRRSEESNVQLAKLMQSEREALAVARAAQEASAAMRQETAALRAEIRKAQQQRDEYLQQVVRLNDELHGKRGVSPPRPDDPGPSPVPPGLEGRVVEVWGSVLVEVSFGSDDGLKRGHWVDVRPAGGNAPPIQIEVMVTKPDRAICRVVGPVKTGMVKKGDWAGAEPDPFAEPSSPPKPDPIGDPPPKPEKDPFGS